MPTKIHIVKVMFFPVVMYGCESWTIKKAEHQRIDASILWYWRRLLRVPWTARRSNQSILKEINPEYSLEGPMLRFKLQYFGHLMWRANSLEKTLSAGKDWGQEEKGMKEDEMVGWHHWLSGHEFEQTLGDSEKQDSLACCCSPWVTKSWTQLSNWTKTRSIMGKVYGKVSGNLLSVQFSHSVTSDSMTPWTAARQASLSITNSQSLLKPLSI